MRFGERKRQQRQGRGAAFVLAALLAACGGGTGTTGDGGTDPVETDGGDVVSDGGTDAGTPDGGATDGGVANALKLKGITPPRGQLAGGTIVVFSGKGFTEGFVRGGGITASTATQVSFGGNAALDVNVIDDDTIEVKTPAGTRGPVDVTLKNPNGTATCAQCFTYFESIELDRLSPAQGSTRGGDVITLRGKGFVQGALVLVGANAASDVVVAADGLSLTARTPPGTSGSADVGVVGRNSSAFLRRAFVYTAPVAVTNVSPPAAPLAGGVDVTIEGDGFSSDATVQVGGVDATSVTVSNDQKLVARVPAAAAAGVVDVTVKTRRGQATLARAFAYYVDGRDVELFAVSPRQGPTTGGTCAQGAATCLEIAGVGFSSGNLSLRVGAAVATVTVVDDHHLRADLPAGAAGVVDLQVRTERGGAILRGAFAYLSLIHI